MTTDNTMTLAYQNVKKAQTQITTKDYKLRIAYQRLQTKDGPIDKRPFLHHMYWPAVEKVFWVSALEKIGAQFRDGDAGVSGD